MRKALSILVLGCLAASCGAEANNDAGEEAAATAVSGKSDALAERVVFGRFENASPKSGAFASLELEDVPSSQLPAAYFEGRYTLEETREDGDMQRSAGAFNVYRYGGTDWIRFVDDVNGTGATSSEKYAWSIEDGLMRFEGLSGETFALMLIEDAVVEYDCRHGVDDSEYLPYETPARLLETLEVATLVTAGAQARRIATAGATYEGMSLEEYVASFDDGLVEVYELSWAASEFEMVRGWRGDTEVGVIFDAGLDEPIALISDGDIMGCRDGECDWNTSTLFPDSTQALHRDPLATELDFVDSVDKLTPLMEAQLRVAMADEWNDVSDFTAQELLDYTDDGGFTYYEVGDTMHWLKWYGGDTEVGAFFEKDTTNLVGRVSDGNVSACVPVQ